MPLSLSVNSRGPWRDELRRLVLVCAIATGLGAWLGSALAGLCVGLAGLLAWHYLQLWRLDRWLRNRDGYPSATRTGYWGRVSNGLYGLQRRNRKRRKRVKKVLQRFRQAAEALPEAAVILDGKACIRSVNPSAERLLGLRKGEDYGMPITHLLRAPAFAEHLRSRSFERPIKLSSPLGDDILLQVSLVPYGGNQMLLLARDITRLSRLEQMRTDLVGNVSHELRTPLTVMMGNIEALEDSPGLDGQARAALGQARAQSMRMCAIVEDLLRLSRLEADPEDRDDEPVTLLPLFETIATDLRSLESTTCNIAVDADASLAVAGDYGELYSAMSNLASNAVRHTPEGTVAIRACMNDDGGLSVQVTDTGIGIESHHLPRLTERFYRVDASRAREDGGTGLGLAIVKHVLMRHDARLSIASAPGEGSTFVCEFPAHRVASTHADAHAA